ncbi:MAG: hypothetical protein AAF394_13410, partial [Planctomycetota bacterium]
SASEVLADKVFQSKGVDTPEIRNLIRAIASSETQEIQSAAAAFELSLNDDELQGAAQNTDLQVDANLKTAEQAKLSTEKSQEAVLQPTLEPAQSSQQSQVNATETVQANSVHEETVATGMPQSITPNPVQETDVSNQGGNADAQTATENVDSLLDELDASPFSPQATTSPIQEVQQDVQVNPAEPAANHGDEIDHENGNSVKL